MPAAKTTPLEIRVYVSEKQHLHVKSSASEVGTNMSLYVRNLIEKDMESKERHIVCRTTDPLIESMHPLIEKMAARFELVKAMAEKMGVDLPDSEGENSAEKEG